MIIKHIGTIPDEVTSHKDELVIAFCGKNTVPPDECIFQVHGGVTDVYYIMEKECRLK